MELKIVAESVEYFPQFWQHQFGRFNELVRRVSGKANICNY